jgi:hypothetical protein
VSGSAVMLSLMADGEPSRRLADYRRQRQLASDRRAGRFSRRKALGQQERFIRGTWRYLVVLVLMPDLLLPGVWLLPSRYRGFLVGLIVPIGPWLALGTIVVFSGAASTWMGRMGEIWTTSDLRWARRHGWKFVNDLYLTSQIDHVALGPAGVLVIETKWSADPWQLSDATNWRRQAALSAVRDQTSHVSSLMRNRHSDAPIIPVVVQWRPPTDRDPEPWQQEGSVVVVDGPSFRAWISSLPAAQFDRAATSAGWAALVSHVDPRDQYVAKTEGPAPRTVQQLARLIVEPLLIALVALYSAGSMAKIFKPTQALIAAGVLALAGYLACLTPRARKAGLIWGTSIVVVYIALLTAVLARHYT